MIIARDKDCHVSECYVLFEGDGPDFRRTFDVADLHEWEELTANW